MTGMTIDTSANNSFSREIPGLQLGVDSTSLGAFKTCPKYYELSIIHGLAPTAESVHLLFGIWMHEAREQYDRMRFAGETHDDALVAVVDRTLRATWNPELNRPWMSDHKQKNRMSLIRSIIWYLDHFGPNDALTTVKLNNGKPAVELSFRFDSGFKSFSTGAPIIFCGHLDRIVTLPGSPKRLISDLKTTTSYLRAEWFHQFTPGNQFSLYSIAAKVAFEQEVEGLVVDGVQIGTGFTKFARNIIHRPEEVLAEWLEDTSVWLRKMEECAIDRHWPQNDTNCTKYGGCPFQGVCSRAPAARAAYIKGNFRQRVWDPMVSRGDV